METPFFPFKVNGNAQGGITLKSLIRPKIELIQDCMLVLITRKFDKDLIKGD